ncbi:hypothetical protein EGW08_000133 [Elysia chlorotica]|uniref:Uncharacterized protein n=1 Tax=Elysia chlorotica TaxID=188477 RepID=A0A3S5K2K5_ELYCH|nr:hypothetical protein EGW08_000133 [Elysia chlorotica]
MRTYKDDILYQTVKENHKRTPFVSSDHQIVNMGADIIRNIERNEKLVTTDLKRSQTALLNKLEQLQKKQESINSGTFSESDRASAQRRNSTSIVSSERLASPTRRMRREFSTFTRQQSGSSGNEDNIDGLDISQETSNLPSPRRERTFVRSRNVGSWSGSVSPDMKEARRLSFAAQEETSRVAMQKLNALVDEHKRRATIATGASHLAGLLPSPSDLARLTEIAKRSMSIEEEDNDSLHDRSDDS